MRLVNVHEAKTHLSRLLESVEAGEVVTIARSGKPVADLVPHRHLDVVWGTLGGTVEIADDFDAPDPLVINLFEGR